MKPIFRRDEFHKSLIIAFAVFASAASALAQDKAQLPPLGWDKSDDPAVIGYRLYYSTNSLTEQTRTNAVMIDTGTNTVARGISLAPGRYQFAIACYNKDGIGSPLSFPALEAEVPKAPTGLRTVILQHSADISGSWSNALFLRLKVQ